MNFKNIFYLYTHLDLKYFLKFIEKIKVNNKFYSIEF